MAVAPVQLQCVYASDAWEQTGALRAATRVTSPFVVVRGRSRIAASALGLGHGAVAGLVGNDVVAYVGLRALLAELPCVGGAQDVVDTDVSRVDWCHLAVLCCPGGRCEAVARVLCLPTLALLVSVEEAMFRAHGTREYLLGEGALRATITGLGAEISSGGCSSPLSPGGLWPAAWEELAGAYASGPDASGKPDGGAEVFGTREVAVLVSAFAQLCLLRGDLCAFGHLVAALSPGGLASRQVVFYGRRGRGGSVVFA